MTLEDSMENDNICNRDSYYIPQKGWPLIITFASK